jgi:hypothetical protein
MADQTRWEYCVVTVGGIFGTRDNVLQDKLNALGLEGWEAVNAYPTYGQGGKVTIVLKRLLTAAARRRREWEPVETGR